MLGEETPADQTLQLLIEMNETQIKINLILTSHWNWTVTKQLKGGILIFR